MYIYIYLQIYVSWWNDDHQIWSLGWDLLETCIDGGPPKKMKDTLYHIYQNKMNKINYSCFYLFMFDVSLFGRN